MNTAASTVQVTRMLRVYMKAKETKIRKWSNLIRNV